MGASRSSQTYFRKNENESVCEIDESEIWNLGALRYLGPNEAQVSSMEKGIKNENKDDSVYSKYCITSSKKDTSHQKEISSESLKEKKYSQPYTNRKKEEHADKSSNSAWESSLSTLDRKLDYATNLLSIPSSENITGTTSSDSVDKKLTISSEVDESAKVYEQDILSPINKRKNEVHPEDAKKQDNKQQDAKKQQEQTQSLMQEAWAPEASAGLSTDGLENNKNKLSSDEAKSLEAQAVSQKELKDSSIEGVREKLTETVEVPSKVSEASVDKATKESEDGKPSTTSQPDVHKTDEKSNEATLQELAKKQIAQDETSKLLPSESEQDNATTTSKSFTEKQELATPDKSVTGEHKSTTDQPELAADKKSQSKDNLIKPTPVDISQQKSEELSETVSQQSQSGESIKTDKSSIQEVGEEVKSTVKKSVKEKSKKVESDESVKPKKSTVKKKVLEKTDTESRESTRIPKVEIQGSTSPK